MQKDQGDRSDEMPATGAQAIRRSIAILRTVAQLQRSGATSSRIARAAGMSRSTTYRILRSLTDERILRYREEGRTYWIGPLARELGLAVVSDTPLEDEWRPVVQEVAQRTRLTSYLMARSGNEAVCLVCVQGMAAIRAMPIEVGQRVPLGIGAGSLAILASLDDEEIDQLLTHNATALAVFPGSPISSLRDRIGQARLHGFSTSSGSMAPGLTGVGVLVPARAGRVQLAVTVSAVAPSVSFSEAAALASTITSAVQGNAP